MTSPSRRSSCGGCGERRRRGWTRRSPGRARGRPRWPPRTCGSRSSTTRGMAPRSTRAARSL
jgi:hypothetical protein